MVIEKLDVEKKEVKKIKIKDYYIIETGSGSPRIRGEQRCVY